MNISKRSISMTTAVVAAATLLSMAAPAANADNAPENTQSTSIVSSRTFPRVNTVKKDLLTEATSTDVDKNSNWGGIENLNVPETQSQAEAQAELQRQQEAAAANRSEQREELNNDQEQPAPAAEPAPAADPAPAVPASKNGAAIASYASGFAGKVPYVFGGNTPAGWDCSGFVQYVFSQFGVSLPRTSGAQAGVGTAIPSLAQAQPGDIIANGMHAAIYIGNGMVVNALNPAQGTQITSTAVFSGGFSIRRVL